MIMMVMKMVIIMMIRFAQLIPKSKWVKFSPIYPYLDKMTLKKDNVDIKGVRGAVKVLCADSLCE